MFSPCPHNFNGSKQKHASSPRLHHDENDKHLHAGAGGPACADHHKRPCTNGHRLPRNSTVPKGHIGPDGRDLDWLAAGNTPSRCAGVCDDDIAACYCDPKLGSPKHGRVPAPPGSPPGAPPLQEGRPLLEPCSHPQDDGRGNKVPWGTPGVSYNDVYGPGGWCVADNPVNVTVCGCRLDGSDGAGCVEKTEMVCPNQCSGRGACRMGFCRCDAGWWGLDCAHAATSAAAAAPPPALPRWLRPLATDAWGCAGRGAGCPEERLREIDAEWQRQLDKDEAAASRRRRSRRRGLLAAAEPAAAPAVPRARDAQAGGGGGSNSSSGAGGGAGGGGAGAQQGRRRPLIYVYDVPAPYVARMLQYRMLKDQCSWRWFGPGNATVIGFFTYATEALLLELLLASPHRTLDPEEADFFFVPAFSSCYLSPVFGAPPARARPPAAGLRGAFRPYSLALRRPSRALLAIDLLSASPPDSLVAAAHEPLFSPQSNIVLGWADHPFWYTRSFQRINHAVMMTHELLQWVKTAHPYWNRTGGADHIWHFAHDEGACWAPSEIYNASIILTHWGRTDLHHESGTSYWPVRGRERGRKGGRWGRRRPHGRKRRRGTPQERRGPPAAPCAPPLQILELTGPPL